MNDGEHYTVIEENNVVRYGYAEAGDGEKLLPRSLATGIADYAFSPDERWLVETQVGHPAPVGRKGVGPCQPELLLVDPVQRAVGGDRGGRRNAQTGVVPLDRDFAPAPQPLQRGAQRQGQAPPDPGRRVLYHRSSVRTTVPSPLQISTRLGVAAAG